MVCACADAHEHAVAPTAVPYLATTLRNAHSTRRPRRSIDSGAQPRKVRRPRCAMFTKQKTTTTNTHSVSHVAETGVPSSLESGNENHANAAALVRDSAVPFRSRLVAQTQCSARQNKILVQTTRANSAPSRSRRTQVRLSRNREVFRKTHVH